MDLRVTRGYLPENCADLPQALRHYYAHGRNHVFTVLEQLDRFSRILCIVFSSGITDAVRLGQPWKPGFHGQYSNSVFEGAHRITLLALFVIKFSVGGTFWAFGQAFQVISANGLRAAFTFHCPPNALEERPMPNQLKVMTYNICFGPEWMVAANDIPSKERRRADVIRAIREQDCDVVCLQEMFDEGDAQSFIEEFRAVYPFAVFNVAPSGLGLNSGLVTLSKYPIESPVFWEHRRTSGMDSLARKGALAVTVRLPDGSGCAVFNTHFNAPGVGSEVSRAAQMRYLMYEMEAYREDPSHRVNGVITCGDFNARNINALSPQSLDHGYCDLHPQNDLGGTLFDLRPDAGNQATGWNRGNVDQWKVDRESGNFDHIVISKEGLLFNTGAATSEVSRMRGASDHLGVIATIPLMGPVVDAANP